MLNIFKVLYLFFYTQVHSATGRCIEYLCLWQLFDYAGHSLLRCFFPSYGTV